jgi:tetrahydromethanopterin S-methyltransferase subunit E
MTPDTVAQAGGQLGSVVHFIQLAIAPVFLLTAIGAMLGAMTNRVARIVDRARDLEQKLAAATEQNATEHRELQLLGQRARLINRAITLTVLSALMVCLSIGGLFVDAYWEGSLTTLVAWIFGASLAALICGLGYFLREIYVATATLRIGIR